MSLGLGEYRDGVSSFLDDEVARFKLQSLSDEINRLTGHVGLATANNAYFLPGVIVEALPMGNEGTPATLVVTMSREILGGLASMLGAAAPLLKVFPNGAAVLLDTCEGESTYVSIRGPFVGTGQVVEEECSRIQICVWPYTELGTYVKFASQGADVPKLSEDEAAKVLDPHVLCGIASGGLHYAGEAVVRAA